MAANAVVRTNFVRDYAEQLAAGNAALFVGAGLSVGSGYVDWAGLMKEIADEIGLSVDRETDLVAVAQYHENTFGSRVTINRTIINAFTGHTKPSTNHELIARLPIKTVWTTNYDDLLERAYQDAGKICQPITTPDAIPNPWPRRDIALYKMHGDVRDPAKAVVTKNDYETYRTHREEFITVLASHMLTHTFLFLGFSFTDPNLDYLLGWIRARRGEHPPRHYWITKRVDKVGRGQRAKAEYEYNCRKQELRIHDLGRYGIRTILVDRYDQVTEILNDLAGAVRKNSVFISGSAHDYEPLGHDAIERLTTQISAGLIARNYRVVTGFGSGIGGAVLLGAVEALYLNPVLRLEDMVLLRPFPKGLPASRKTDEHTRIRRDLLGRVGYAVFISGNRLVDGRVEKGHGVIQEFDIATEGHAAYPIPIGATGHAARELWFRVVGNHNEYFGPKWNLVQADFVTLGSQESSVDQLLEAVFRIIAVLRE